MFCGKITVMVVFCLAVCLVASQVNGQTFIFQNGTPITSSGPIYSDAVDLALDDPARNDPTAADQLRVRYLNGLGFDNEVHSALIHFDNLDTELADKSVLSASLSLTFQTDNIAWTEAVIDIYPVNHSWNTLDADWNNSDAGQSWEIPGARGMPGDRGDLISSTSMGPRQLFVTQYSDDDTYAFNLDVSVVQSWIDQPVSNNGVIMVMNPNAASDVTFSSSEDTNINFRPRLEIVVVPEPATLSLLALGGLVLNRRWTKLTF